jgi:RHS repeat-associated protein
VIEERDGSDNVLKQYIYGNGIDEILRMDKNENGVMVHYYFHTNAINSTTAVTDQNGNIIERYSYDIYGMPIIKNANGDVISQSAIGNEYMFHGRRYDKETNLYYFRARYYDPIMGRFLSVDPMGYKDSMNLYQAFNMNPINFIDPWGLAIINLFIGFEMNKANAYKVGTSHGPIPMPYPNLENLKVLASQHGHTLNIFTKNQFNFLKVKRSINDGMGRKIDIDVSMPFNFSKKGFEESVKDEETWTFYVGHTFFNPQGNYIGLDFGNKNYISKPRLSKNRYIGIFGCSSSDFSSKIFPFAKYLFSIKDKSGEGWIGMQKALYAAYFLIKYLIITDNFNPKEALEAANTGLLKIEKSEKDRVILQP